ncbi:hypothetical protein NL676_011810 [Syzygium grande]|nr:hypothetical protein NL676_011810 [Syzygium grande]
MMYLEMLCTTTLAPRQARDKTISAKSVVNHHRHSLVMGQPAKLRYVDHGRSGFDMDSSRAPWSASDHGGLHRSLHRGVVLDVHQ